MSARLRFFSLGLALCLAAPEASADNTALLGEARAAYDKRADPTQARLAVDKYAAASQAAPSSYEAAWEGARAVYFYGEFTRSSASDKEKVQLFQDGIDRAKRAVELRPQGVEGHFWLGVLYGVWGEAKGILKSLSMAPLLQKEVETSLALDRSIEGYGPDRVLGRVFFRLPWFKGGDNKKAIEHFERSLAGTPSNALTRLYLAEAYKAEGNKARAIELCRSVVTMTPDPRWAAEHPLIRARAQKLLKKLE